jgi:TonB family protein
VQSSQSVPEAERSPETAGHGQARKRRAAAELRRLAFPLLISLLFHALLLSLTFGHDASGLPGLGVPWRERRIVAPDLRVVLAPAPVQAAASSGAPVKVAAEQASIERATVARSTLPPTPALAIAAERTKVVTEQAATRRAVAQPDVAVDAVAAQAPPHTEVAGDNGPSPMPPASVSAADRSEAAMPVSSAAEAMPTPVMAVAPDVESSQSVLPADRKPDDTAPQRAESEAVAERVVEARKPEPPADRVQPQADHSGAARVDAAQIEAARQQTARAEAEERREAERREAARIEAERVEAQRREAERLAAQLQQAQRQEAARQEAARIDAERREVERLEAARQAAERQEAAQLAAQLQAAQRQEAAREEAARIDAERREAARQSAERQEAARVREEQEEDARREARRRAMARQLEAEAAQREGAATAATPTATLPLSLSTARRVRLWGRSHPDVELVQYAEAWALKVQLGTPIETVRELARQPHTPALVTVAMRSDGSVESVSFELSSGAAAVDEAIRRIVEDQRPYPPFPPALARRFDVIEIRRTWRFDTAVRLY